MDFQKRRRILTIADVTSIQSRQLFSTFNVKDFHNRILISDRDSFEIRLGLFIDKVPGPCSSLSSGDWWSAVRGRRGWEEEAREEVVVVIVVVADKLTMVIVVAVVVMDSEM